MLEKRFDTAMIEPSTIVVTPLRRLFPGDDGSKNLKKKKERKKEREKRYEIGSIEQKDGSI